MTAPGWNEPIDAYCERLGPGLLAEPLNLFSNLAFILAGLLVLRQARRALDPLPASLRALGAMAIAVGVGSALFHSVATRWAALADVPPIAVFLLSTLGVALRRGLGWGAGGVTIGLVAFVGRVLRGLLEELASRVDIVGSRGAPA
ncbi:MAG: hypothetical protein AAGH15_22380 [Myxococcota bacterium]